MTPRRSLTLLAALVTALALGACEKEDATTEAETEGIYLDVGQLTYQVQMSRQLNPADTEDRAYLRGVDPAEATITPDQVWFGIFLRAENEFEEPAETAHEFEITDTLDNRFEPLTVSNVFAYEPVILREDEVLPDPDSPAGVGPIQGSLLLFKLTRDSLANRPLKFHIADESGAEGEVDLDV